MNLNSPGAVPGFPHRRITFPAGEITVTRWLPSVTYRLPSGPIARASGWSSPSGFTPYRAKTVKGFGRAAEPAAVALGCPPAGAAAFVAQPAPRTARLPTRAAAARRLVIFSMVPPSVPTVVKDARPHGVLPHRGCPQAGTVASTETNVTTAVPQSC